LDACPGLTSILVDKAMDLQAIVHKHDPDDVVGRMQFMEKTVLLELNTMCEFQEEFQCLAEHADLCGSSADEATALSLSHTAGHMQCFCSSCPGLKVAYAKYAATLMQAMLAAFTTMGNSSSGTSSPEFEAAVAERLEDNMLAGVCPLHGSIGCVSNATACESLFTSNWTSVVMSDMAQEIMTNETAAADLKQKCDAKGLATSPAEVTAGAARAALAPLALVAISAVLPAWE